MTYLSSLKFGMRLAIEAKRNHAAIDSMNCCERQALSLKESQHEPFKTSIQITAGLGLGCAVALGSTALYSAHDSGYPKHPQQVWRIIEKPYRSRRNKLNRLSRRPRVCLRRFGLPLIELLRRW